ncbi:MAG: hypothetical protein ACR2NB_07115, partial [Solirubrobacteraceae bacterium]
ACARLSLGDGARAALLASEAGAALRASAEALARAPALDKPWLAVIESGADQASAVRADLERARDEEREYLPARDRRRRTTEYDERIRRFERRVRTATIDHALQLAGLWLRDLTCVAAGAPELAHNADRGAELAADAEGRSPAALREAVDLVEDTRARLALNVSEELALEALAYRLERRRA